MAAHSANELAPRFLGVRMIETYFLAAAASLIGGTVLTCSGPYFPSRTVLFGRTGGVLLVFGAAMLGVGVRLLL